MSAARPAALEANWSILDETEQKTAQLLLSIDQGHLFEHWPAPGSHDADKKAFLAHALALDGRYPGGLRQYAENARKLLEDSKQGVNPYAGWVPRVPTGERLTPGTPESDALEALGMQQAADVAFVLVAGGLGERLGYNGIKLDLPSETTTGKTYLELYIRNIQALQDRARAATGRNDIVLPLMIMTSDDTHSRTVALLNDHNNFGAVEGQITILKQEKLPAMFDNQAHFALDSKNPFEISTKPHGHGDVHMLLFQSGLVKKWVAQGKKWVVFFQDTNGLVFRAVPAALGVSAKKNFDVNTLTVSRKAGEAVGAICQLVHTDGRNLTISVEYNQLDPLLRSTVNPNGDTADASGFSPFPGNINVLVFAAQSYAQVLDRTSGLIPEFVNPNYADATKTKFQSPTRLESMMQDYPKLLDPSARVGFTQCERWMCFSAVKNNVADAAEKFKKTGVAESASSGENDLYYYSRHVLGAGGKAKIDVEGKEQVFANIPVKIGARVVLEPSFGTTQAEILSKFKGGKDSVSISSNSTLVLDGPDVTIGRLELDGALIVRAVPGAKVHIDGLKVHNKGWHFEAVDPKDPQVPEKYRIRGYVLKKEEQRELVFDKPGQYTVQA